MEYLGLSAFLAVLRRDRAQSSRLFSSSDDERWLMGELATRRAEVRRGLLDDDVAVMDGLRPVTTSVVLERRGGGEGGGGADEDGDDSDEEEEGRGMTESDGESDSEDGMDEEEDSDDEDEEEQVESAQ